MVHLSSSSATASTPARPRATRVKQEPTSLPLAQAAASPRAACVTEDAYARAAGLPSPSSAVSPAGAWSVACKQEDESADGGESARRRPKLSAAHVEALEGIFERDPAGAPGKRAALARQFGVSQQQIATWFQNRRARQRTRQLQHDFDLLRKCLRAAFTENQALKLELDDLRQAHAHCLLPPSSPPAAPAVASASLPALRNLPAPFAPPQPGSPEKRPRRTLSAPLLKRARLSPAEPAPAPLAAAPPHEAPLPALPVPFVLPTSTMPLPVVAAGSGGDEVHSGGARSACFPAAPEETTLDEAFRDLLTSDPLDGGLGGMGHHSAPAPDLAWGGYAAQGDGAGAAEWGAMEWEGEADSALEGLLSAHALDPMFDLEAASQACAREDLKMQAAWWH
ncbi:Homeobox domain-containing protein [Klebsormidium nitens]|uniref:Homeobox domain-containing protein n=1 Tax=Klebsormidium nitens TaxID=105231 RepID=A0A1Y1IQR6_KLENI|nr:Homeobox domain-containing protein [Klebsormidium nitens]|eukprot:GAQ91819.1 Homeobox domain-containing protein [Klebsormidium nitens]